MKRRATLTNHVFNDRRDLKSDSARHSLSQKMQRFYIINQHSLPRIDHLTSLKYSQSALNNKKEKEKDIWG